MENKNIINPVEEVLINTQVTQQENLLLGAQGKVGFTLTHITGKTLTLEKTRIPNTKYTTVEKYDTKIIFTEMKEDNFKLPVSANKLFMYAQNKLLRQNDLRAGYNEDIQVNSIVKIPLMEYAILCDKPVICGENATKAEKQACEDNLKYFRRTVEEDIDILRKMEFKFVEDIQGREEDYKNIAMNIIAGRKVTGLKTGVIKIEFSQMFLRYALRLPMSYVTKKHYTLDNRSITANKLSIKLQNNYYNDANRKHKAQPYKYKILKVRTLINATNLPTDIEELNSSGGWKRRAKKPFEKGLNTLIDNGILSMWDYRGKHGTELPEEKKNPKTFEEWLDLNVYYELTDKIDDENRIRNNEKRKEARLKKQQKNREKIDEKKAELIAKKEVSGMISPIKKENEPTGIEKLQAKYKNKQEDTDN